MFPTEAAVVRACSSREAKERVGSDSTRSTCHAHALAYTHINTHTQGQIFHPRAPNGQHVSLLQSQPLLYRENAPFKDRLPDQTLSNNVEGASMTGDYELGYQPSKANNTILHKRAYSEREWLTQKPSWLFFT